MKTQDQINKEKRLLEKIRKAYDKAKGSETERKNKVVKQLGVSYSTVQAYLKR